MTERLSWIKECFNPKWRWNRKKFWLYPLGLAIVTFIPIIALIFLLWYIAPWVLDIIGGALIILWYIPMIIVSVLSYMKRLRDLDKNPWMTVLMVVPFISIGLLIYCGFWKWTVWENRYGSDPLGWEVTTRKSSENKTEKSEEL